MKVATIVSGFTDVTGRTDMMDYMYGLLAVIAAAEIADKWFSLEMLDYAIAVLPF